MAKKTNYFPHDFGARTDPKLQNLMMLYGCEGVGIYWCIIEMLYEQGGNFSLQNCNAIAFNLHVKVEVVNEIVLNSGLFSNDGEFFWSESVNKRMAVRNELTIKRQEAIKARWETKNCISNVCNNNTIESNTDTIVLQKENLSIQNDTIKIKENKKKINNNIDKSILFKERGEKANRFVPPTLQEVQDHITSKGYCVDAISFVAFYESKNWMVGKNKMKSWQSALVTWERREREKIAPAKSSKFSRSAETMNKLINDANG